MEKCSKCDRHASLPFYLVVDGELHVLCFACACNAGLLSRKTDRKMNNSSAPATV